MISYDISHNKLRNKISKKLLEYGLTRIQYSVFMGDVRKRYAPKLKIELENMVSLYGIPTDSVIILPIDRKSMDKIITLGRDGWDWDDIKGIRKVLII